MHTTQATLSSDRRDLQTRDARATFGVATLLRWAVLGLPVWLALAPAPAGAAVLGSSAINADIVMPMGAWTTLNAIVVPASPVVAYCTAVGSADVNSPAAGVGTYLFTLTLDNANPPMNLGQERTLQYVMGGPGRKEVGSTQGFVLQANANHIVRWQGRPAPGNPATTAEDRSLTVVCDQNTLGIFNSNPEPLQD